MVFTKKRMLLMAMLCAFMAVAAVIVLADNGEGGGSEHGAGGESGSEAGGEHGAGGEGGGEAGGEEAGGEEGGTRLPPDAVFGQERKGSVLILGYVPEAGGFVGVVGNISNATLQQVRVEVHLFGPSIELGPTTPVDLAPGQWIPVWLPDEGNRFTEWVPHAEVGPQSGSGGEGGGEHGSGGERGGS